MLSLCHQAMSFNSIVYRSTDLSKTPIRFKSELSLTRFTVGKVILTLSLGPLSESQNNYENISHMSLKNLMRKGLQSVNTVHGTN